MNATISVICYKSKTLSNGEHPLMLRIAQDGKSRYKSLKISVDAKYWDFEKSEPKSNCPNKDLKKKGRVGTSYAYLNSYRVLKHFNKRKKLNFTFSHIDVSFCKKFEEWLRSKGNKDTTISYQLRTLRATFNRAIEAKIVAKDKNPFTEYKLSHLNTKTMKRALSKSDIMKIMQTDCTDKTPTRQLGQDLFAFSYLCGGISFVDIANLTPKNIIDNRLI